MPSNWKDDPEEVKRQLDHGARFMPDSIMRVNEYFCGCGNPEVAWAWIRDYLQSVQDWEDTKDAPRSIDINTGPEWMAAYLLHHCKLTEHGGIVTGCWLTKDGKEALAFLKEHGPDWSGKGFWVDRTGCTSAPPM